MYTESGTAVLVGNSTMLRKYFYKADAELDKYEVRHDSEFWLKPRSTEAA